MIYPQPTAPLASTNPLFGMGQGLGSSGANSGGGGVIPANGYVDASGVGYADSSSVQYVSA